MTTIVNYRPGSVEYIMEKAEDLKTRNALCKKKQYWRERYGIVLRDDQLLQFNEHKLAIKKILPILEFIQSLEMI